MTYRVSSIVWIGLIGSESAYYSFAQSRIQAINLTEKALSLEEINKLLEGTPTQEDYPQAGAVVLLAEEAFEVFEDNTAEFDMHFMIKIFTFVL